MKQYYSHLEFNTGYPLAKNTQPLTQFFMIVQDTEIH